MFYTSIVLIPSNGEGLAFLKAFFIYLTQAMRLAAKKVCGAHDFRNLCKMDVANGVVKYTRAIHHTDITYKEDR